ncbi:MAG TPA: RusA family crossover junction endodeoxyribonuclease [Xanthobacteraceae bacterium]|nr:RusA family crossover junction endodeoxyribonuclease [Xanthobacteraceae bacterium]
MGATMIARLEFRVDGFPQTKGSWKVAGRKRNGAPRMLPDNPAETSWAESVAWAAKAALRGHHSTGDDRRYAVALDFTLVPPPNRGKTNRRDLDKLARSVLDALTGIVWHDDEQVDRLELSKSVTGPGRPKPGVAIVIVAL